MTWTLTMQLGLSVSSRVICKEKIVICYNVDNEMTWTVLYMYKCVYTYVYTSLIYSYILQIQWIWYKAHEIWYTKNMP